MYSALSMTIKSKINCLGEISKLFSTHQISLEMVHLFIYLPYPWEKGKKNPENS